VLVFVLVLRVFRDRRLALITGLLFAVHPIQCICVNYVADRGNLFAAFFSFLALILLDKTRPAPRHRALLFLAGHLSFVAALLSRESALLLSFFTGLCFWAGRLRDPDEETRGDARRPAVRDKTLVGFLLLTTTAFLFLRQDLLKMGPASSFSWGHLPAFSFTTIKYLCHAVWPEDFFWIIREIHLSASQKVLYPVLLAFLLTLWAIGARRSRPVLFGGAWFLVSVLPLYGLMTSRPEMGLVMQDNQVYIGALGLLFLAALGIVRLSPRVRKKIWRTFLVGLLALYAVRANILTGFYRDPEAFLRRWLERAPRAHFAAVELGKLYFERGDYDKALPLFLRGLTHRPKKDTLTLLNIAGIYYSLNDYGRAKQFSDRALRADPGL